MYITEEERHHALGRDATFRWSRAFSNLFGETKCVTWPPEVMPLFGMYICDVIGAKDGSILLTSVGRLNLLKENCIQF